VENTGPILTLQVRTYQPDGVPNRGGDGTRQRLVFTAHKSRVPEAILRSQGFTPDDPEFDVFVRLLFSLWQEDNTAAGKVLNVVGNMSSGLGRVAVRVMGEDEWTDPVIPGDEVPLGRFSRFLSHPHISQEVVEIDGQWEFAPSEELSASLLEFFKEAEDNGITDDCVDRAILENWKPSWDAWYAAPDASHWQTSSRFCRTKRRTSGSTD
jgi:hypothetical protein